MLPSSGKLRSKLASAHQSAFGRRASCGCLVFLPLFPLPDVAPWPSTLLPCSWFCQTSLILLRTRLAIWIQKVEGFFSQANWKPGRSRRVTSHQSNGNFPDPSSSGGRGHSNPDQPLKKQEQTQGKTAVSSRKAFCMLVSRVEKVGGREEIGF